MKRGRRIRERRKMRRRGDDRDEKREKLKVKRK